MTYYDIDGKLRRAEKDGEQIKLEEPEESPIEEVRKPLATPPVEKTKPSKPPGKLFGKSLIDDLEERKNQMRSKSRQAIPH